MSVPQYDVVVFGAASFVGSILSRYLLETFGGDGDLKWAAAGRSEDKLRTLKASLGPSAADLPIIHADAFDEKALEILSRQTKVVVSTVGPYALYGEAMVRSCVENGTDYCDLTGEVHWMRRMIERYENRAKETGARIVHACGYDSIPSDLGVLFLQDAARESLGRTCPVVHMGVAKSVGGFSGGTYASMVNTFKEAVADPSLRKELTDPYTLCGSDHGFTVDQPESSSAEYVEAFRSWTAPFMMAGINTKVVFRSNLLLNTAYGKKFRYGESTLTGEGTHGRRAASRASRQANLFILALALPPSRWILRKFVLPKPGEGPGEEERNAGSYDLRFYGEADDGRSIRTRVTGDMDPGYGSTAKMLGQAAACLASDEEIRRKPGGFWTPAALFGSRLIERLERDAGMKFEVLTQD